MNLEQIRAIASEKLENRRSYAWAEQSNKFYHGKRVAKMSVTLRKALFPSDDKSDEILTAAGWFHDILNGEKDHASRGAEYTAELLSPYMMKSELDEIVGIIAAHDDRNSDRSLFSDRTKLIQDADLLDHFGTYDIMMFIIGHNMDNDNIEQMAKHFMDSRKQRREHYRSKLNYELSRRIFDEKSDYYDGFAERFSHEANGEFCIESLS